MGGRRGTAAAFVASLALMLALAVAVQVVRDRAYAASSVDDRILYIRSGAAMQRIGLSFDAILADVYWIRAIQQFGQERLKETGQQFDLLYPLLDLTTSLDPRFSVAYRFGAIFLAEPHPGGAGRPDLAIELLKKGIAANPTKADYYHDIGFIYYWNLHDYRNAAAWFNRGAEQPGAPWWLKTYAAVMLTRGGDRQASRAMWQQLRESAENDWLRTNAEKRLLQLDALDQIDALQQASEAYSARTGAHARSWEQLIGAGVIAGVPLDPTGTPYLLEGDTGDVGLGPTSKLHPLPTEPAAAPELRQPR
jgi:tetratricopeptide (TPR) repeat protein